MRKTEIPSIRFRGFDDAWEQRKLGDIVERVVRKNTNNESSLPLTISAQYGLVDQITYFNNRVASRDVSNYYLVLNGEFAYNKSTSDGFPFGAVKRLDLYEKGVLSTLYIVFSIKNQSEIDSDYLTVFFDTDRWHKGVSERAAEGARNHGLLNISADDFFDIDIFLPRHKEEQVAIGSYLRHLDHLITLHQRKYDKLTNVKKSMLEKMFPKNGSNVPEIRFKGFTEAWEQRKVSDVAEICTGGTPSTGIEKYWYPKEIPWLSSGEVHKKYITYTDNKISVEGMNNSSARMIPENSVLIALAGQGKTRGTVAINRIPLTTNQSIAAMAFSNEVVPEFVFCNLESRYEEIRRMSSGDGSRGGLNKQIIGETEIPYTSKEEQTKIGAYFFNLDNLITLHQRELEKLKNIKKSCLENMFV